MTLREGVKFHNGDELTSEDVAYTFRDGRLWGDKAQIPGGKPYFGVLASGRNPSTATPSASSTKVAGRAARAAPRLLVRLDRQQARL